MSLTPRACPTSLYGTVLAYEGPSSLAAFPTRNDLLDAASSRDVDALLSPRPQRGNPPGDPADPPLLFLPNSLKEFHEKRNGHLEYRLLLIGILTDGRKSAVILEGISPHFEVRKPNGFGSDTDFHKKVSAITSEKYKGVRTEAIFAKGFDHHELDSSTYIRIFFSSLWDRKNAIKYFTEILGWATTTDDDNHFERVACRESPYHLAAWNVIASYISYAADPICKLPKVFRVNHTNFKGYTADILQHPTLAKDRTLVETWDIEAYSSVPGVMPDPHIAADAVFAIGKTYHWKDSPTPLLSVILVSRPCNPRPDKITIYCRTERDLIVAAFSLNRLLQPDFIAGFNDGDFDWPFVIQKAINHKVLLDVANSLSLFVDPRIARLTPREQQDSILKWDFQKKKIKLEADTSAFSSTLALPGYINIDVRTMFRKLYPTEQKTSLKHFLAMSNLGGKEDMAIEKLFKIYKRSIDLEIVIDMFEQRGEPTPANVLKRLEQNKEDMADVSHYCVVDAMRCQELLQKVNLITDKREVAIMSRTSLYDAFYFADGMKVRNLIIAKGQPRGLLFTSRVKPHTDEGKYPGAHVYPPIKGTVKPKLTVRERKASIPAWGAIPEVDLLTMEKEYRDRPCNWGPEAKSFAEYVANYQGQKERHRDVLNEYDQTPPTFSHKDSLNLYRGFCDEENAYPVSGLDFASLYPSIIMAYNLSPEFMVFTEDDAEDRRSRGHDLYPITFDFNGTPVNAWSILHDTTDGAITSPGKTIGKFGLYPSILKELFDIRDKMKTIMKSYATQKEVMKTSLSFNQQEYDDICFQFNYLNSKQKALKVFMNTFYGETGNKNSPFFVMAIAGGITSAGQRNLKMIGNFVVAYGCKLYYGDTDSLYISSPPHIFAALDRDYFGGVTTKVEYCTALVTQTFLEIEKIRTAVNSRLITDNGTTFLKMAYEEVLYPCWFLMKKMYAGVAHEKHINFSPDTDDLFTKGLALKRRGTSDVLKTVCREILSEVLSLATLATVMEVVEAKITDIYNRKWVIDDFVKTAVYKPSKQNISVRTFLARMVERANPLCPPPVAGERFDYVVVKKYPYVYDERGRKSHIKVGDMWEYKDYAIREGLPIDLDYYMTGGIIGQFAQFVMYLEMLQARPTDSSPEAYDVADKKTLLASKKHVETICKKMTTPVECRGGALKEVYKLAAASYVASVGSVFGDGRGRDARLLLTFNADDGNGGDLFSYIRATILEEGQRAAAAYAEDYIGYMRQKYGSKIIYVLLRVFSSGKTPLLKYRVVYATKVEDEVRREFITHAKGFSDLFTEKAADIHGRVKLLKSRLGLEVLGGEEGADYKQFKNDPSYVRLLEESVNSEAYTAKIEAQRVNITLLGDLYDRMCASTAYVSNTKAIIERLKYYVDADGQENPRPPGVVVEDERRGALDYIRAKAIEF